MNEPDKRELLEAFLRMDHALSLDPSLHRGLTGSFAFITGALIVLSDGSRPSEEQIEAAMNEIDQALIDAGESHTNHTTMSTQRYVKLASERLLDQRRFSAA